MPSNYVIAMDIAIPPITSVVIGYRRSWINALVKKSLNIYELIDKLTTINRYKISITPVSTPL